MVVESMSLKIALFSDIEIMLMSLNCVSLTNDF